ncbi:unnamed protein product [Lactuca saligna]|uniref:Uncharacterized protein n=1 Tax=Lactuca saligna TaxID=75948 RepID=A0AA36DXH9_LACSI|nr:unnamed protein product [Lactuca saligna]
MDKKIAKKKKKVIVEYEDEIVPESHVHDHATIVSSLKRDSPITPNVEASGDLDGFVKTFHVDTTINQGIPMNISNMDTNVIMGKGVLNNEAQGNSLILISSTFDISTISTNLSLPPFVSTVSTTLPPANHSPTFDQILQQPITSIFPSQSIDGPKKVNDDANTNDGEFAGTFDDLEFDPEEENIPDHMLMSGKQLKIYNKKLNSSLQLQADVGGSHSISEI